MRVWLILLLLVTSVSAEKLYPHADGSLQFQPPGELIVDDRVLYDVLVNWTAVDLVQASVGVTCSAPRLTEPPAGYDLVADYVFVSSFYDGQEQSRATPELPQCAAAGDTAVAKTQTTPLGLEDEFSWMPLNRPLGIEYTLGNSVFNLAFGETPWQVTLGEDTWFEVSLIRGLYEQNRTDRADWLPQDGTSVGMGGRFTTHGDTMLFRLEADIIAGPWDFSLESDGTELYSVQVPEGDSDTISYELTFATGANTEISYAYSEAEGNSEGSFEAFFSAEYDGWPWNRTPVPELPEASEPDSPFTGNGSRSSPMAFPILVAALLLARRP